MRLALVLLVLLVTQPAIAQDDLDAAFDKDVLVIHASEHACYRIDIYLAETNAQRTRGLMHVRSLPESTGMLFVYPSESILSIWMKNTYIPLDILFIKADGQVSSIYYDAEPQSLRSMRALEPVQYVLELNAGVAEKLSIDEYSRLEWLRKPDDE
jgi:uncharacterized membrane protein (UPF0127 family)